MRIVEESGDAGELAVNDKVVHKRSPVDDLEVIHLASIAEDGEDGGKSIARADTDDEGDELHRLKLLLRGADDNGDERHKTAEETDEVVAAVDSGAACLDDVTHCGAREGKTDQSDRRPDDDGRHQLGDPLGADEVDHDSDHNVDKTCEDGAYQNAAVTEGGCDEEGVQEREGASEEDRALELREEQVHDGTNACAEDRRRDLRGQADDGRDRNGRSHDGKHLLKGEDEQFAQLRLVFNVINKAVFIHMNTSIKEYRITKNPIGAKLDKVISKIIHPNLVDIPYRP